MARQLERLFNRPKPVIAMIHTGPSPGVPGCCGVRCAVERAVAEARLFAELGVDGLLVENMHDFPCIHEREMGPEVAAFMTHITVAVKRHVGRMPVGVQVLFQANKTAIAVAHAAGADFVRAEGWTHAHVSDKGIAEACAGEVLRYRKSIGADHIPVLADVKKKHASHTWTADLSIEELAKSAEMHCADAVVVTGSTTGHPPEIDDLEHACEATALPVFIGSGLDADNFTDYVDRADGFIIGSAFKENGDWRSPVCENRVRRLIGAVEYARGQEVSQV
ncbi:MAG: BtpA/SgcQ family protein [Rubricoccaceae bacterium]|nr:BtpA/SgcQ family protein [Rubricoccaceae bacterium]